MEKENFDEKIPKKENPPEAPETEVNIQEKTTEEMQIDTNSQKTEEETQREAAPQEVKEERVEEVAETEGEAKEEPEEVAAEELAEEKGEEAAKEKEEKAKDPNLKWYVIHTYSGYENKVKNNLAKRIQTMEMQDKIFTVLVPTEEEIEFRDGKRRTVQKKIYPGYVYVEMIMTDESWNVVRNTPGVTGFVGPQGPGFKPIPLDKEEVRHIRRLLGMEAPIRIKLSIDKNQGVRVKSGPFRDFTGIVDEIYPDREKVKVLIYIFGRETPVELDFGQVQKL